jgi:tellurite resistance protein
MAYWGTVLRDGMCAKCARRVEAVDAARADERARIVAMLREDAAMWLGEAKKLRSKAAMMQDLMADEAREIFASQLEHRAAALSQVADRIEGGEE